MKIKVFLHAGTTMSVSRGRVRVHRLCRYTIIRGFLIFFFAFFLVGAPVLYRMNPYGCMHSDGKKTTGKEKQYQVAKASTKGTHKGKTDTMWFGREKYIEC